MLMGGGTDTRIDVVSVVDPQYTLHTAQYGAYTLCIKCDRMGDEGAFVCTVMDEKGKKIVNPDLPESLRISFVGGSWDTFIPLELRLEKFE